MTITCRVSWELSDLRQQLCHTDPANQMTALLPFARDFHHQSLISAHNLATAHIGAVVQGEG
jgi:hypothetical protein